MLTIIHGDDIAASRRYYTDLRKQTAYPVTLAAESVTLTDLAQALEGGGLFATEQILFIEEYITKKKKTKEYDDVIAYLKKQQDAAIYLWEPKELDRSVLTAFKTDTIKLFKIPQSLFLFLDAIKPNNGKTLLPLFRKTLETADVEMVFFMLIRQFRFFLIINDTRTPIDDMKRIADWQRSKLQKQASLFSDDQLKHIYNQLYQIDKAQKTGQLTNSLTQAIDLLLLEI